MRPFSNISKKKNEELRKIQEPEIVALKMHFLYKLVK